MKKKMIKTSPYLCALLAGLTLAQPLTTAYAVVIPVESVVKTKYSKEIKEVFTKMEEILVELEGVEDIYTVGQNEEYLGKVKELLTYYFKLHELDEEGEFVVGRKDGDLLDVLFARTVNILYEIPMGSGHPIIEEFATQLRDSYFEHRYLPYKHLLKTLIRSNPDGQLTDLFTKYDIQLDVFGSLPPDYEYNPDAIPEINSPGITLPDFSIQESTSETMKEEWKEEYADKGVNIDLGSASSSSNKPQVYASKPANRVTYDISYKVVGKKCLKTKTKIVNGKKQSTNSEVIPDNIAYNYCPTSYFADLYGGFQDDELIANSSQTHTLKYIYNEGKEREVSFLIEGENISYNQLISILDMIVKEQGGKIAYDKEKTLYVLDGKPLVVYQYEGDKSLEEVNKLIEKYVPLQFSISKEG